ncbi:MAG: hypothetical protein U5K71_04675 [Gracilimonas sp.]|nr:hypothetical protein [Gracilimonas sp.]
MQDFKLIFHHDQRLDKLSKRKASESPKQMASSLQDFMKPTPPTPDSTLPEPT